MIPSGDTMLVKNRSKKAVLKGGSWHQDFVIRTIILRFG
jgi:hypothetical protein